MQVERSKYTSMRRKYSRDARNIVRISKKSLWSYRILIKLPRFPKKEKRCDIFAGAVRTRPFSQKKTYTVCSDFKSRFSNGRWPLWNQKSRNFREKERDNVSGEKDLAPWRRLADRRLDQAAALLLWAVPTAVTGRSFRVARVWGEIISGI